MVEMCPDCGDIKVSITRTSMQDRMTTIYYRCGECAHEWREKKYR